MGPHEHTNGPARPPRPRAAGTSAGLLGRGPRAGWARAPMGVHMGPHGGPWGHIYVFVNIISFISCINNIDILLLLICFVAKGFCWTPLASLHAASAYYRSILLTPCIYISIYLCVYLSISTYISMGAHGAIFMYFLILFHLFHVLII